MFLCSRRQVLRMKRITHKNLCIFSMVGKCTYLLRPTKHFLGGNLSTLTFCYPTQFYKKHSFWRRRGRESLWDMSIPLMFGQKQIHLDIYSILPPIVTKMQGLSRECKSRSQGDGVCFFHICIPS